MHNDAKCPQIRLQLHLYFVCFGLIVTVWTVFGTVWLFMFIDRWKLEPNVCDCLTTPIQILTPDFNWPAGPSVTHYKEGEVLALDVFVFNLWTSAHEKSSNEIKHTHTHLYSVSAVWQHAISDVVWCNCFISLLIDVVWCIYSLMNVLEFGCAGKRWPVMIHLDKHLPQKAFFDLLCESSAVALPLKCCCSVSVVLSWLNWRYLKIMSCSAAFNYI